MESGPRYSSTGSGPADAAGTEGDRPDAGPGPVRTFAGSELDGGRPAEAPDPAEVRAQPGPAPAGTEQPRVDAALVDPAPDEPLAVVAVGPAGADRTALLAALLDTDESGLRAPEGSYLVVRHGREVTGAAYVPGYREPHGYATGATAAGPALARPPRRVELTHPEPLLRRFDLVDAPDTGSLGLAGTRVLLDVVERSGALLFVISADQALGLADLDLLTQVARGEAKVFFAVTPGADGWPEADTNLGPLRPEDDLGPDIGYVVDARDPGPTRVILAAHRAALLAAVPALADADWFAVDPEYGDTGPLRGVLVDWADREAMRRVAAHPPVPPNATRTVPVARDAHESEWADWLDREVHTRAHRLRQHLALELAHIHLRCVQELVFGGGCRALPGALDRELHALSLRAVAESDLGVERILTETLTRVFGQPPDEAVRRRVAVAVRWGFAEDRGGRELARVLLVTSTGGVATVTGARAVQALAAYPGELGGTVLPPIGAGLSGGCYQHWRNPANADTPKGRSWLQRALREVELELARELTRRFKAVQVSLGTVLNDAVDHGILLA
ncbi:hypothetical protein [Micromonospora sp. NBC_01796]|uniref:hypothetical protein n=1 Tax=Micromonospora sp. NBC_01796 TaxID=2975987 RepID=UPI002DDB4870|nr:hypothetical protein [Micromonospora sp. NBC_01796]WSA87354.1 hypothetical protein OIE47_07010 [Micromonospora sp. NBC_01796]